MRRSRQVLTDRPVISRSTILRLLAGVVLTPIAIVLLVGVASLLSAMQDAAGAALLSRAALGLGIVWIFLGVCLLLALAASSLDESKRPPE